MSRVKSIVSYGILLSTFQLLSMDKVLVKKEQIDYVAKMHQLQNPNEAKKFNIAPIIFPDVSGKLLVLDPKMRVFYYPNTLERYPSVDDSGFAYVFDFKHKHIVPTKLLIAGLQQDEDKARSLLRFYPLAENQIIPDDNTSKKMYEDDQTFELFIEALCASKVIGDNKVTQILLNHLDDAGLSEQSYIDKKQQLEAKMIQADQENKRLAVQQLKADYQNMKAKKEKNDTNHS